MNRLQRLTLLTKAGLLLVCLVATATAQVYETTDKEGNPSFSDEPSPDATEIELQQTNTVEPPSPQPAPAASQNTVKVTEQKKEEVDRVEPYIVNLDGENEDRRDKRLDHERAKHLPADAAVTPLNKPEREAIHREPGLKHE